MRLTSRHVRSFSFVAATLWLAACVSTAPRTGAPDVGARAAEIARSMIGVRYVYGGESPKGFDCSGLAQYSYARAGLAIPRESVAQQRAAEHVKLADALPGDLL